MPERRPLSPVARSGAVATMATGTDAIVPVWSREGSTVPVTPIEARCRRCGGDFSLFELRVQRTGVCPRCGWILTPDWTAILLEDAAVADIAQRHLVNALRRLRNLPGNVVVLPHTIFRNLFEEVGWQTDLADETAVLREEVRQLRRLVAAWELLDPEVVAAQPHRSWIRRLVSTGTPSEPVWSNVKAREPRDGTRRDGEPIGPPPADKPVASAAAVL
jgi:predicted Zn-ribbon and HTH transcriptional regulator